MGQSASAAARGVWSTEPQHSIADLLHARLDRDPDGAYLDVCGTAFTAADVDDAARRLASAFAGLGVSRGSRVATLLDNSPEQALAWWGAVTSGSISVPINTAYKGRYLAHQLHDSGASLLIVDAGLFERYERIAAELSDLGHVCIVGDGAADVASGASPGPAALHTWDELMAADPSQERPTSDPSDLATFIYTGGTTGMSKGCMLSHNYHEVLARQTGICWRRTAHDVFWTPLPLFHYNAIITAVLGALIFGGRSAIGRKFSVSGFWPEINRVGATISGTLGSMAYLLAKDADRPEMRGSGHPAANATLRLITAAPLPPDVDATLRTRFGVETFSGAYGVTEASLISWCPEGVVNKPRAAGVVNREYFDARIFDDHDNELPRGSDGEIVVRPKRPDVMFDGYWGQPEATVAMSRNWWYHTGDIGRIDEDDFLYFVDRKADYLRRRGENVSSYEVESILMSHGALADVVVHAVPSELTEDDIKVTATLKNGAQLTAEELFRWSIAELPYFALPRYIEFRDELPRSPVGRVLKRLLRDEGVTAATWDSTTSGIVVERR